MKYEVTSPVEHDGKRYLVGKGIELDDETAGPLLRVKAIKALPLGQQPAGEDVRIEAIVDAIGSLDVDNKSDWLQTGSPDLAALEKVLGWSPTAAERDTAWSKLKG